MITLLITTNYSRYDFQEFIEIPREFIEFYRKYHYFHFLAFLGSMRPLPLLMTADPERGAQVCAFVGGVEIPRRGGVRTSRPRSSRIAAFTPAASPDSMRKPPFLYRLLRVREKPFSRAARTIPVCGVSGSTANAGKCVLPPHLCASRRVRSGPLCDLVLKSGLQLGTPHLLGSNYRIDMNAAQQYHISSDHNFLLPHRNCT